MDALRKAAVAGQFYPGTPEVLRREVSLLLEGVERGEAPLGGFVPHAGYMYSGRCAGTFYGALPAVPPLVVLLGPNHTGLGPSISIADHDQWETPLGRVAVDTERAHALCDALDGLGQLDRMAHRREHSLEVHLPFLQHLNPTVTVLPVTLGFVSFEVIERLAAALDEVTRALTPKDLLVVSSTDMSHFVSAGKARDLDFQALDRALDLDPRGLYDTVRAKDISMCGIIPSAVALSWAVTRGATSSRLLDYTNSGEVSGDLHSVVAYASVGLYI